MTYDHIDRFVALASAGGGLLLSGLLSFVLRGGRRTRAALAVGCSSLAIGVVAFWTNDVFLSAVTALVLAVVLIPGVLHGSRPLDAVVTRLRRAVAGPAARSTALAAAGFVVVAGATVVFVWEDEDRLHHDSSAALHGADYSPPRKPERVVGLTDRGTRIELSSPTAPRPAAIVQEHETLALTRAGMLEAAIRRGPANERSNCFGWVFAHDRYWMTDAAVDTILSDNSYAAVAAPQAGDLAVYRSPETGLAAHTAVVRYVTEGMPVMVEGKWGWMGVFLHPVDRCPYGSNATFYRSPRATHQLVLVGPESDQGHVLTGAE